MKYTIEDFDSSCKCALEDEDSSDDENVEQKKTTTSTSGGRKTESFTRSDLTKISPLKQEVKDFVEYSKEHTELNTTDELLNSYIKYILLIEDTSAALLKKNEITDEIEKLLQENRDKKKNKTSIIIGCSIAGVIVVVIVIFALFKAFKKRKEKNENEENSEENSEENEEVERVRGGSENKQNKERYEYEFKSNSWLNDL